MIDVLEGYVEEQESTMQQIYPVQRRSTVNVFCVMWTEEDDVAAANTLHVKILQEKVSKIS